MTYMSGMAHSIGKKIRIFRKTKGLSLDEMSRRSGVTRDHIGRIERGEALNPRKDTLEAIAQALEIHPHLLLVDEPTDPEDSKPLNKQVKESSPSYQAKSIPQMRLSQINSKTLFDSQGYPLPKKWKGRYEDAALKDPYCYALSIDNDIMFPRIKKSDVVIVSPLSLVQDKNLVVAFTLEGEIMIRYCFFFDKHLILSTQSSNEAPLYFKQREIKWLHKITKVCLK